MLLHAGDSTVAIHLCDVVLRLFGDFVHECGGQDTPEQTC